LGERTENLQVELDKGGWNTTLVPSENSGQTLSLKTLDQVLSENNLNTRKLKLLKIDTEGFDTIILRGAHELIATQRPVIYFEYNRSNMDAIKEDGLTTLLSLQIAGYKKVVFFDNRGRYMLTTSLDQTELIRQLHYYADENDSEIAYYDVCLFHSDDADLEYAFIKGEITF
jgi:hypothetical protein